MKTKLRLVLMGLLLAAIVLSCKSPGSTVIDTAQANAATQSVMGGVMMMFNSQASWVPGTDNGVSFVAVGLSMSGTSVTSGTKTTNDLTLKFQNYADAATGYVLNGMYTMDYTTDTSSNTVTGTFTGNLTLTGGPVSTMNWNVSVSGATGTQLSLSFTGTLTCNSTSFDASTLSLDSAVQANTAAQAVIEGFEALFAARSSWTSSGGDNVQYLSPTLTMNGTETDPGTYVYVLTINFISYAANGYALTGSCNLSLTVVDNVMMSGSSTGTVAFSGGPVTGQTWNVSNITGSFLPFQPLFVGTVTCNGTCYDARSF